MSLITKPFTFSNGATIYASENNSNNDIIYSDYNGNITNANISASAAIADSKIAQITTASKVSGAALTSLSSIPGAAGAIPAANVTDFTLSGQGQGAIAYKGVATWVALDAGSTAGLVLKTNTSLSAPSFANSLGSVSDYGTSSSASTARQGTALKVAYGNGLSVTGGSHATITNLPFTNSTSYSIQVTAEALTGGNACPPDSADNSNGNVVAVKDSGAQVTIYAAGNAHTWAVQWIAIGI